MQIRCVTFCLGQSGASLNVSYYKFLVLETKRPHTSPAVCNMSVGIIQTVHEELVVSP